MANTFDADLLHAEHPLLIELREWRQRRAREEEVPAYIVLTNALMREIARTRPETTDALLGLRGMGPGRLARYGDEILEIVKRATEAADVELPPIPPEPSFEPSRATRRRISPPAEIVASVPYRVVIEYQLDDDARRRLVDELDGAAGPLVQSMQAALQRGPARVSIRIEAEREAA